MKPGSLLTGALLLLLSGCVRSEGPVRGGHMSDYQTTFDTVNLVDSEIASRGLIEALDKQLVSVERHGSRRGPTGALEVLVLMRNRTDAPLSIELRTSFFDQTKFPSGDPSSWQPLNLPPQGTAQYNELSLAPSAAHYLVEVRRAHRM